MSEADADDVLYQVFTLPAELQNRIFSFCSKPSLATLSCLNKSWHQRIFPYLWSEIDFVHESDSDDPVEKSYVFFAICNDLIEESSDRWPIIASTIRKLNLGRLHGINILPIGQWDEFDMFQPLGVGTRRNVFDIIACFTNLQSLTVYVKNWWGYEDNLAATGEAMGKSLKHLKVLKTGGQMSQDVLRGLVGTHEKIEQLSLYNLIACPGQDNGPEGVTFLWGLYDRFTNLKSLELCKLADLDPDLAEETEGNDYDEFGDRDFVSGMRWKFSRESEKLVLEEWARLLKHCSNTLETLTLENRYLCGAGLEDVASIDPGVTDPADYGLFSLRETKRILLPVLEEEWPALKELYLIGMGPTQEIDGVVKHLVSRVNVVQLAATVQIMKGDATPEQISTPHEFYN